MLLLLIFLVSAFFLLLLYFSFISIRLTRTRAGNIITRQRSSHLSSCLA